MFGSSPPHHIVSPSRSTCPTTYLSFILQRPHRQAGSPSFVNPDVQKLLEILITERTELKMWKEREKMGVGHWEIKGRG